MATQMEEHDKDPWGGKIVKSYGGTQLHYMSHGEAFMQLFIHRFGSKGLYIFDEPEAALSPQRQLAIMIHIHNLINKGAQFIIATHSPIILAYPDAVIYEFSANGINQVNYEDTDTYQVVKSFINNPKK